ncbi:helix-turn-helix domain-containing protein [Pasteurella multocida]|uniref:helix-turn-helix domain-containing protein n=1 Tax=Pasteurella multocida TaxID=747 RepID=UPI0029AB1DF9|nr:helix-turn-helix domain-containing protein [Pasteurella multocida]MDX3991260.1 helix-turn-helix domain-containing protein [Pasteurella multocida]
MEKALTIKEVADRLNMSVSAVRNQIYNWNFFKMKGCRGWRILESDLAKCIQPLKMGNIKRDRDFVVINGNKLFKTR